MKYLVTVKIRDEDRNYFDYFVTESNSDKKAQKKAKEMIVNTGFKTIETIHSVVKISDKDRNILINYGVI